MDYVVFGAAAAISTIVGTFVGNTIGNTIGNAILPERTLISRVDSHDPDGHLIVTITHRLRDGSTDTKIWRQA